MCIRDSLRRKAFYPKIAFKSDDTLDRHSHKSHSAKDSAKHNDNKTSISTHMSSRKISSNKTGKLKFDKTGKQKCDKTEKQKSSHRNAHTSQGDLSEISSNSRISKNLKKNSKNEEFLTNKSNKNSKNSSSYSKILNIINLRLKLIKIFLVKINPRKLLKKL